MIKYGYFIIALFCSSLLYAQPWNSNDTDNFYTIQKNFKKWSKQKNTIKLQSNLGKLPGYKQFKRWEWYWEQRVFPTGKFPASNILQNEYKNYKLKHKNSNSLLASTPNWTNLGPSTSAGGYAGLGRINTTAVDPNDANTILVGAAAGGIWKSTNAGSSWTALGDEFASMGISYIVYKPGSSSIIYASTGDLDAGNTYTTGVIKSTDGGSTWNATGLTYNTSSQKKLGKIVINPSNNDILYVCGTDGIHKTTNAGSSWTQVKTGIYYDLEMKTDDVATLFASGTTIVKTVDSGANWTTLTTGAGATNRIAIAVTADDGNYLYAVYSDPSNYGMLGVFLSVDGGTNWSEQYDGTNDYMGYYTDGSVQGGQGFYDICIEADPSDKTIVYIGGVNIVKSTNSGTSWTAIACWTASGTYNKNGANTVHADQHDLLFANGGSTLYVSNDGGMYKTANGGTSFTWLGSGLEITQFYRIGTAASSASKVIAGAQDNGTKLLKSGVWSDVIGGDGMECYINSSNESIMYGTYVEGDLRKSVNGGSSFSSNIFTGGETGSWVTPYILDNQDQSTLIAGYVNVWKSVNDGTTWTSLGGNTGTSKITVLHQAPSDVNYLYQSTGSNLKYSSDGGSTWNTTTKPGSGSLTYLAIDPTTAITLWASLSGYTSGQKVYKSTDAGASWTNQTGTLPNVPCNTIVYDSGNDILYVGNDIGVWYKKVNDSDWTEYNTSLPNVVINELEVHTGGSKINASTYGRGLWQADLVVNSSADSDGDDVSTGTESDAPNNGDGNGDGVQDSQQSSVASTTDKVGGTFVTLAVDGGFAINEVGTDVEIDDGDYFYPYGAFEFKINETSAKVKLYFHDLKNNSAGYVYRKQLSNGTWADYPNARFSVEKIAGNNVLVVTLTLVDGQFGDFDGVVNGQIYDPGGLAIIPASIPSMSFYYSLFLIMILLFVYYKYSYKSRA